MKWILIAFAIFYFLVLQFFIGLIANRLQEIIDMLKDISQSNVSSLNYLYEIGRDIDLIEKHFSSDEIKDA
jgi:F0F1-type ATP synthase membrane subunit b/b'